MKQNLLATPTTPTASSLTNPPADQKVHSTLRINGKPFDLVLNKHARQRVSSHLAQAGAKSLSAVETTYHKANAMNCIKAVQKINKSPDQCSRRLGTTTIATSNTSRAIKKVENLVSSALDPSATKSKCYENEIDYFDLEFEAEMDFIEGLYIVFK